ncbi:MAG: type II CAAX endopeptidase family protein [Tissierellia bacterium]|nr:type II CAAX endopeptidase family protein [Tissierellia bacterium]
MEDQKQGDWTDAMTLYIASLMVVLFIRSLNGAAMQIGDLRIRAPLILSFQWLLLPLPLFFLKRQAEDLRDIGFVRERIPRQIAIGIGIGLFTTFFFSLLPALIFGAGAIGSGSKYSKGWQFVYEFFYYIFGVAMGEEMIFRGFIYHKLKHNTRSIWKPILYSSLLFGLFHIFNGISPQIILTMLLGGLWCYSMERIRYCTTLSVLIAHGLHNFLIQVIYSLL